jgi:hypothetical protein
MPQYVMVQRLAHLQPVRLPVARPAALRPRRPAGQPRAAAEKEGTAQDSKLQAPDAPPGKGAPVPPEQPTSSGDAAGGGAASEGEGSMSAEEIQRQMGQLRAAAKAESKKDGLVEVRTW